MSNYADKLRKYARKLSNTDDSNKHNIYNRKMNFYRNMLGGAENVSQTTVDQQLQAQSNNITQMLASVESSMNTARSNFQQKVGALNERANYAAKSFTDLQEHSRHLCAQVKQLTQDAANQKGITDQLKQKEAEISALQVQVANSGDKAQIDKLNNDLADVQKQLDAANANNAELNKQLGTKTDEITALQTQLAQQPQITPDTQKTIDELTAAKAEADKLIADQNAQISQYQKGIISIANILSEFGEDSKQLDSIIDIKNFTAELCGQENEQTVKQPEQEGGKKRKQKKYRR